MNDRQLYGISVCITYVVLGILCLFLALSGLIPFPGDVALLIPTFYVLYLIGWWIKRLDEDI